MKRNACQLRFIRKKTPGHKEKPGNTKKRITAEKSCEKTKGIAETIPFLSIFPSRLLLRLAVTPAVAQRMPGVAGVKSGALLAAAVARAADAGAGAAFLAGFLHGKQPPQTAAAMRSSSAAAMALAVL